MSYSNFLVAFMLMAVPGSVLMSIEAVKRRNIWSFLVYSCAGMASALLAYNFSLPVSANCLYTLGVRQDIFYIVVGLLGTPHLMQVLVERMFKQSTKTSERDKDLPK